MEAMGQSENSKVLHKTKSISPNYAFINIETSKLTIQVAIMELNMKHGSIDPMKIVYINSYFQNELWRKPESSVLVLKLCIEGKEGYLQ